MTFEEWWEREVSARRVDETDVMRGVAYAAWRAAFEAGRCEAGTDGLRDKFAMASIQGMVCNEGRGNSERGLKSLLNFAQDDGLAATYQSLGQYRSEIIKMIASILVE